MNVIHWKYMLPKLRSFGPYVLIELLLPGGTLLAILLWLAQGIGRSGVHTIDPPVSNRRRSHAQSIM